uniref:PWWP domain-containing protein n=1 Tax=Kalanchoe fedtschenkoi TaxID=63787 RepID=A0A7N0TZ87_KALFE
MGSSGSESVDFGVGSIVWVRRRNGSWWPGKILGPDDLSNTHLMSPRSGTPVKLLGREDASVDWYNLEKSKRVKVFRCGDFDDCIERAESSVGMPSKKREKYARREDAILHALELEKQILDNQGGRLDSISDIKISKSSHSAEKGSVTSSGNQESNGLNGHNALDRLSEGIGASPMLELGCQPLDKTKEAMLLEDEAPPKMRGLQEFGLRTFPSKRKFSSSIKRDEIDRPNSRCQARTSSAGEYSLGKDSHINFADDRKTSNEALIKETSLRGYYRCTPAVQLPQNSANLSSLCELQPETQVGSFHVSAPDQIKNAYQAKRDGCLYLPAESNEYLGNISEPSPTLKQVSRFPVRETNYPLHVSASDDNASGFSEDTESDSSDSDDLETDSDEEMNPFAGRVKQLDSIEGSEAEGRHGNMSIEELDRSAIANEIPFSADDGVSKWQLKGKRNLRSVSKRSVDIPNAGVGVNDETYLENRGDTFNRSIYSLHVNYQQNNDTDSFLDGEDLFERDYWSLGSAVGNTRHPTLRHMPRVRSNSNIHHTGVWDDMTWEHRTPMETRDYYTSNYHDQVYVGHGHVGGRMGSMLVEVDLEVQPSYPKQRVPIISLMSKIDGRAIIGHPLQVEGLEEGSADTLFRSDSGNGRLQCVVDYVLPSVWKTARRTANYRVPRPDLSSAVDNGGDADYHPLGRKPASMELYTNLGDPMQQIDPCALRPHAAKKPMKKISKKVSMSSCQKTRTLSSFDLDEDKQIGQGRNDDVQAFSLSELIKYESGPTTVACIPVKLVFSRLYEAVGRPPASIAPLPCYEDRVNTNTARMQN